jgi:RpiB/LacA/LacB family sugar-phosphate isomerase
MRIFIGADHRGFHLKAEVIRFLKEQGHDVIDVGTYEEGVSCDYPKISYKVASRVAKLKNSRGILVCLSGIGHAIAANKVPGAYAALCYNKEAAALAREHNNSNILVLSSQFVSEQELKDIVTIWLNTLFAGGRHLRRVRQIKAIEKKFTC